MTTFDHTEICMGTAFRFAGRTELPEAQVAALLAEACRVLHRADATFSTYKPESPISRLARGETNLASLPPVVAEIWDACDHWEKVTNGWFSAMTPQNTFDPSGLVKTWAAAEAAAVLVTAGIDDFTMNAGGDVWLADGLTEARDWRIGVSKPVSIASPEAGVLTVIDLANTDYRALATSGSAERGEHIWNPKASGKAPARELLQVSVVAKDLVTADIWATAAFAEGPRAIADLNKVDGIEAIFILPDGELAATDGFVALLASGEN
ncbi:FAD:protein FMN transferase [Rhodoluna sp. KAS3]|uniref:FAD:protein FMN transferase n=1 Tax=Rhodoluna sp. KAS3 TaxID=942880 RepID=UPI00222E9537|nr:FAD:protein FMN transferase [Rhodoluna sp. KAS3]BDS48453.1 FAD:protein FMN transferase [Rhodoluna sp. KAS3]